MAATEMIIFEITEDEGAESCSAITLGSGIHVQEDIVNAIRRIPRETEDCYFEGGTPLLQLFHSHFMPDEVPEG